MKHLSAARAGVSAYERAAEKIGSQADVALSDSARQGAGSAIHWATGIAAGALYAIARKRWQGVARTGGLPFGAGFLRLRRPDATRMAIERIVENPRMATAI